MPFSSEQLEEGSGRHLNRGDSCIADQHYKLHHRPLRKLRCKEAHISRGSPVQGSGVTRAIKTAENWGDSLGEYPRTVNHIDIRKPSKTVWLAVILLTIETTGFHCKRLTFLS